MSNALNLLRAMRASKVSAVAGVLHQPTVSVAEALDRRAVAAESVVTESRRIRALPRWDIPAMSKQAEPGGPLDYTPRLRAPGGTYQLSVVQNLALYWAEERKGLVGPLAVGSGKGWLSLFIPMVMGALRPVLFIPNNMQIPLRREMEKLAKHFKLPKNLYIIPYSQLSVAKSTDILDQLKPDLIVCDECFTYDTCVTTDEGQVPIGDIVERGVGSQVLSYNPDNNVFEWRDILRRMRRTSNKRLVKVKHTHGEFVCTFDHKIWTSNRGYVNACDLSDNDCLVCPSRVFESVSDEKERSNHCEVLLPFMFEQGVESRSRSGGEEDSQHEEDEKCSGVVVYCEETSSTHGKARVRGVWGDLRIFSECSQSLVLHSVWESGLFSEDERCSSGEEPRKLCMDACEQSNSTSRSAREDEPLTPREDLYRSGRERETDAAAGGFSRGTSDTHRVRHQPHIFEGSVPVTTYPLQGGPGFSGAEAGDRGGWQLSSHQKMEVFGQAQDFHTRSSRVESVEVLEQGGRRGDASRVGQHPEHVYDIEVAVNHNYIADGVVVSNCHNIKNPDAARSRRVLRYFREHPNTRFVALSGTLTSKSLRDYAHLCEIALRAGTPLPTDEADLIAWSNCVDSKGIPQEKDWALFSTFVDLRGIEDPALRQEKAREHFKDRFTTTPGVVATSEASVSCSLNLLERKVVVPDAVTRALYDLNESWARPDGEIMRDAIALWRLGMQMSQGFYLRWVWPDGIVDHEWLNARAAWFKEVRVICQRNIVGMDSPFLVWQSMVHGRLTDPPLLRAWSEWEKVKDRPKPPTETVWIDDFLIRDALDWRKHHPKGIIWHSDLATEYALRAAGVPTYGKGEVAPEDGSKGGVALSIRVHGTGLNLQYAHHENLILSMPSGGKTMEQLLGRTHRQGQEADEVNCWHYGHTGPSREALVSARADALYLQQTHGSPQKLVYCTYV